MGEIPTLDMRVDVGNVKSDITKILHVLRPNWKEEDLVVKKIEGEGLMNHIWNVRDKNATGDPLLFKIFGPFQFTPNRVVEWEFIQELHKKHIIMPVYCKLENGYVFKYAEGETLTPQQLMDPHISRLIIEKLHQFHSIQVTTNKHTTRQLFPGMLTGLQSPELAEFLRQDQRCGQTLPTIEEAQQDAQYSVDLYNESCDEFPVIPCHWDVHMKNVVYNPSTDEVAFLDFEMVGLSPEVVEIANHLSRDPGCQFTATGLYPWKDENFKRRWLRQYLELHPQYQGKEIDEPTLQKWLDGVNKSIVRNFIGTLCFGLLLGMKGDAVWMQIAIAYYQQLQEAKALFSIKRK